MVNDKSNKSLIEFSTDVFLSCLCSSLRTAVHTRLVPKAWASSSPEELAV